MKKWLQLHKQLPAFTLLLTGEQCSLLEFHFVRSSAVAREGKGGGMGTEEPPPPLKKKKKERLLSPS